MTHKHGDRFLTGLLVAVTLGAIAMIIAATFAAPHGWVIPVALAAIYVLGWIIDERF